MLKKLGLSKDIIREIHKLTTTLDVALILDDPGRIYGGIYEEYGNIEMLKVRPESQSIYTAAMHGHIRAVKYLHNNRKYNINQLFDGCMTAAEHGHFDVLKLFMTWVDIPVLYRNLLFEISVVNGHLDIAKHFSDNINIPFHTWSSAAYNGHLESIKYLTGIQFPTLGELNSALVQACNKDHFEIAQYLVGLGANPQYVLGENLCCVKPYMKSWLINVSSK